MRSVHQTERPSVLCRSLYRNFEQVVQKARMACFNSGQRVEDHFVDITEMVAIGSGAQREIKATLLSRYACYLIVQNADPAKEIVAIGQSCFAVQTRRQELTDQAIEDERRLCAGGAVRFSGPPRVSAKPQGEDGCGMRYGSSGAAPASCRISTPHPRSRGFSTVILPRLLLLRRAVARFPRRRMKTCEQRDTRT